MGGNIAEWTKIKAHHFKPNNEVDRAAEIESYYSIHMPGYRVLKAAAVGSIVYCLVLDVCSDTKVMHVCRTMAVRKEGTRWFAFSICDESEADAIDIADSCPQNMLAKLAPPQTDKAALWRQKCLVRAAKNAKFRRMQRAGAKMG